MFPVEFSYSEIERKNLNHLYPVKNPGVTGRQQNGACDLSTYGELQEPLQSLAFSE